MKKEVNQVLYMTLYHHRHGTSFCLILVKDNQDPEKVAEKYWIKADGLEPRVKDRDPEDYVEVSEACLADGNYYIKLEKIK